MRHVPTPDKIRFIRLLDSWRILAPRQRVILCLIAAAFIFASFAEMLALSSVIPFVGLIIEPGLSSENRLFILIADALGNPPTRDLTITLGIVSCTLVAVSLISRLVVGFLIERFAARMANQFARELMVACLRAPYIWFLRQNASALGPRIYADAADAGIAIYPSLMEIVYTIFVTAIGVGLVIMASPTQSLAVLFALFIVCAVMLIVFRPLITRFAGHMRQGIVASNQTAIEIFEGVKDIKVKSRESAFAQLYENVFSHMMGYRFLAKYLQQIVPLVILSIGQLGLLVLALILFVSDLSRGELAAQLTLLIVVLSRVLPATTRAVGVINKLSATLPHLQGLLDLHEELTAITPARDRDGETKPDVPADWTSLALDSVSFHYENATDAAITNVNIDFGHGQSYGIVGPSGAGKSTLVDVILGLLAPGSGTVRVDDQDLRDYNTGSWFRQVGYVPQAPYISDDTLRRNIAFGIDNEAVDENRIANAVRAAGLEQVSAELEEGLGTRLGDRGMRLSGGQRQRVAIARALYHSPRLLVLDEATAALDNMTEQAVLKTIREMHSAVTTIVVTHKLTSLTHCDRIFVVEKGSLVAEGTYAELLDQNALFGGLAHNAQSPAAAK